MKTAPEGSRTGETVGGKYRIVRLLAQGGMGVVYEAQHTVVRRRFAIKFLRRELAERRDILTRFQREAEAAGALENENVTAAVDFGISDDGTPYIVMEYLVGENLASLLEREGRLPAARAADLVSQACRGVEAAHATGIVHRDLKPQNLFVCRRDDGTDLLKVLDFGVAKLQDIDDATAATRTGTVLGTAAYMSPEQARGEKLVDNRADIYALGAILYELVSQKRPHPGDSQNAILHHIATQPAVPLESVRPGLPAGLADVVSRALASDPQARPPSADALAQLLAPYARHEVRPATRDDSGSARAELNSTVLARGSGEPASPSADSLAGVASEPRGRAPAALDRRRSRAAVAAAAGVALAALAIAVGVRSRTRETAPPQPHAGATRTLAANTRFYVPPPRSATVQQIARLAEAHAFREAALITAMEAVPHATFFTTGSPDEVEAAVRTTVARAEHDGGLPVLVPYNLPYRDCAQYSAGGARDGAAYRAWIEAFARGIGSQTAIVILEPDSLGIVPYATMLYGPADWCKPTVTDAQGKAIPAPGATADEHYALIASAIDRLAAIAPNALVYLDGTHSTWLWVPEIAYRLARVGVDRTQGFAVNIANALPTSEGIKYGTWISKCLAYARRRGNQPAAFLACPSGHRTTNPLSPIDDWESPDRWYRDNVDNAPQASPAEPPRARFIVDTSRNGRGPLELAVYASAPFNQPPEIIAKLRAGGWCNPPSAGAGLRPTARTGIPLVDAFLWIKSPGDSDGSCDESGGARAWDYSRFNPWSVAGDTQRHFDPLWGMVDPEAGEWFPEAALQLARYADPPLEDGAAASAPASAAKPVASEKAGRPVGHSEPSGRPVGHVARHATAVAPAPAAPATRSLVPARAEAGRPMPPTFDPENPYR